MDICARGLKAAAAMLADGGLEAARGARYAAWDEPEPRDWLAGKITLDSLAAAVEAQGINPQPRSGRQEILENYVSQFI
jgi:xylose isomerase